MGRTQHFFEDERRKGLNTMTRWTIPTLFLWCSLLPLLVKSESAVLPLLQKAPLQQWAYHAGKLGLFYGLNLHQHLRSSRQQTITRQKRQASKSSFRERLAEFAKIDQEIQEWAQTMLTETTGWTQMECHPALKRMYNPRGETQQLVKWMPDSRGRYADPNDRKLHPCMKVYSSIDAPMPIVCRYLSQEKCYQDYNSLLIDQREIEALTSHSKICWSQTKKLLFIQPREFITYCAHKWRRNDGSQIILNQACNHPHFSTTNRLRALGLRGVTILSKHPSDPNKTNIVLLSHCNCGNDIPEWAVRTAVGVLAPIKPFEIIHRINVGVTKARHQLERLEAKAHYKEKNGKSQRPGGMAQMGYACFWPKGGGLIEE